MEEICKIKETLGIVLSDKKEFPPIHLESWKKLGIIDQKRFMLKWPLPELQVGSMRRSSSDSSLSDSSSSNPTSSAVGVPTTDYHIVSHTVTISKMRYRCSNKFSVQFTPLNKISDEEFFQHYINTNWEGVMSTEEDCFILPSDTYFPTFQSNLGLKVEFKYQMEIALTSRVYTPLKLLIMKNLTNFNSDLTRGIIDFLVSKGLTTTAKEKWPDLQPEPNFLGGGGYGTFRMGFNLKPDLCVGFRQRFTNPEYDEFVCLTAIGRVELPCMPFDIAYELEQAGDATNPTNSKTEFSKTVTKIVTMAVHTGVTRLLITNYVTFILIELDPSFDIINTQNGIRMIKSRHMVFRDSDEYIRLRLLFFLWNSEDSIERMKLFQTNVLETLRGEVETALNRQRAQNMDFFITSTRPHSVISKVTDLPPIISVSIFD